MVNHKKKFDFSKIWKVINTIILIFVILIAGIVVFSIVPFPGNFRLFTVQSGSMEPAIKTGSLVVIKLSKDYKVGDIITFYSPGSTKETITHRVYKIKDQQGTTTYETKGDANDVEDSNVLIKSDILGKVILKVPYLGYPPAYARTVPGLIILIIIPATIIVYEEINKIRAELKRRKKKIIKVKLDISKRGEKG